MSLARKTSRFVDEGVIDDDRKLSGFGVDGLGQESLPYYARWARQDLMGIFYMANHIATYVRVAIVLLVLIAIPLWIIALK